MSTEPEVQADSSPALQCISVRKSYRQGPEEVLVLDGLDMTVARGEVLGIVGESGSGKSTVMNCLYFDDEPTSGSAYLSDWDEGRLDLEIEPEHLISDGEDNLVLRAAQALWQEIGRRPGARLKLEKRIPVGGGMGGGSADAAGALILLDRLWSLQLPSFDLRRLAADLGSDVPFFLTAPAAVICGRGEHIQPLTPRIDYNMVIVYPGFKVGTAEAYGWLNMRETSNPVSAEIKAEMSKIVKMYLCKPVNKWKLGNTFSTALEERFPQISRLRRELENSGALYSGLSGSGSTVFALYDRQIYAERAASTLSGSYPLVKRLNALDKIPACTLKYIQSPKKVEPCQEEWHGYH